MCVTLICYDSLQLVDDSTWAKRSQRQGKEIAVSGTLWPRICVREDENLKASLSVERRSLRRLICERENKQAENNSETRMSGV